MEVQLVFSRVSIISNRRTISTTGGTYGQTYIPVDALEVGVCFDVFDSVGSVAQSIGWITFEKNSQKRLSLRGQKLGHP